MSYLEGQDSDAEALGMRHYPVFLDLRDRRVVVSGAGAIAVAKLRLLLKTEARIVVFGARPGGRGARPGRRRGGSRWSSARSRPATPPARRWSTARPATRRRMRGWRRSAGRPGALVNIVDNLEDSDFITPAIVDRDPVTVAIGTEGAAPVLARKIKAEVEAMLPATLGLLTRIGQGFRAPGRGARFEGAARRSGRGSTSSAARGRWRPARRRRATSSRRCSPRATAPRQGVVHLVGAGPGDPELLTLKARRLLHEADVVIHDRLVPQAILELARREATIVEVGKTAYGPSWKQDGHQRADRAARARRARRWCG